MEPATTTSPEALWSRLTELARQARSAIESGDPREPLRVVQALTELGELDHQAQFLVGCFLMLLSESTPHFQSDISSITLGHRLLMGSEVEERLPVATIVAAIRARDTRDLFIEASRLASHYIRDHQERDASQPFFDSMYATAMALILGAESLLKEPGIVHQIRGWELIEGDWHQPVTPGRPSFRNMSY